LVRKGDAAKLARKGKLMIVAKVRVSAEEV
jgi:hypothetical protein